MCALERPQPHNLSFTAVCLEKRGNPNERKGALGF